MSTAAGIITACCLLMGLGFWTILCVLAGGLKLADWCWHYEQDLTP